MSWFAHKHLSRRQFIKLAGAASLGIPLSKVAPFTMQSAVTTAQRIGQLFAIDLYGPRVTEDMQAHLAHLKPGGFSLFNGNTQVPRAAVTQFVSDLKAEARLSSPYNLLLMVDQESSTVARLRDGYTLPPDFQKLGEELDLLLAIHTEADATWSMAELEAEYVRLEPVLAADALIQDLATSVVTWGATVGQELKDTGIHAIYGPVLDLQNGSKVLQGRAVSTNPITTTLITVWYAQGVRSTGMQCVTKHAPGLGGTVSNNPDPHIDGVTIELRDADLFPFKIHHRLGLIDAIMVTHVAFYNQVTVASAYIPATVSYEALHLFRERVGYNGPLFTDGLGMAALLNFVDQSVPKACLLGLLAGMDMFLTDPNIVDRAHWQAFDVFAAAITPALDERPSLMQYSSQMLLSTTERQDLYDRLLASEDILADMVYLSERERNYLALRTLNAQHKINRLRLQI